MRQSILVLSLIFLLLEIYLYRAFKTIVKSSTGRSIYLGLNGLIYISFFIAFFSLGKDQTTHSRLQIVSAIFFVFILPKILVILFLLLDDILRLLHYSFRRITTENRHFPSRRKFLSVVGFGALGILTAFLLDGIMFGKYRHWVRRLKVKIPNLSPQFSGYKIVQISDVHSGSFHNPEKIEKAIELINAQQPDLVLFTGDLVNTKAEEFQPFISLFKRIKAKDGKYSVLGNHDYGLYYNWPNEAAERQNLTDLIDFQKQAGFEVLRNENRMIKKEGAELCIVGVENWGLPPFPQFGDLDKATEGLDKTIPKILMSHDPSHFDSVVKNHPSNIFLTLSGHTHGMQFGLDLKNFKWSPVQYKYPKWADLYESNQKLLYVNRGFGVLAYPGRVGVYPEITLFELE